MLNSKLDSGTHIEYVYCKVFKMLGFVMRFTRDFHLGISIKLPFCTLVYPILKYGVVVWDPYTASDLRQPKWAQRRFLWFASHLLRSSCEPHDYATVASVLDLTTSLIKRRCTAGITFLNGLFSNKDVSPVFVLLQCFKLLLDQPLLFMFLIPILTIRIYYEWTY